MSQVAPPSVLTLEEVAGYLRLPPDVVAREAARGQIPGRKVEDTWRFLRTAVDDWLRTFDARTVLLQQAGALAEDESLTTLRDSIYRARRRPETESDSDEDA
jgi:excisionase family DNA binding protein